MKAPLPVVAVPNKAFFTATEVRDLLGLKDRNFRTNYLPLFTDCRPRDKRVRRVERLIRRDELLLAVAGDWDALAARRSAGRGE